MLVCLDPRVRRRGEKETTRHKRTELQEMTIIECCVQGMWVWRLGGEGSTKRSERSHAAAVCSGDRIRTTWPAQVQQHLLHYYNVHITLLCLPTNTREVGRISLAHLCCPSMRHTGQAAGNRGHPQQRGCNAEGIRRTHRHLHTLHPLLR